MLIRGILLALPVLMCAVAVCTPVAGAVPLMQLPWPAGDQHRIYGGYTYGCGTHATSTAPGSYPHIADYYAIDFQFGPVDGSPLDVSSAADGVVIVRADLGDGFGNKVVVDHGGGFYSVYAHFRSSNPWGPGISVGVQVTMGQLLGYAGDTGGPYAVHLHFHLQSGFSAVEAEPMSGVPGPGEPGFGWYGFSMENGAGCHANPNDPSPYWTSTPPFAGTDTPGVWRNREWYLRNDLSPGWPDCSFEYGVSTDTPVMGDWDGDGVDTVGIVRQYATQLQWHLRNDNSGGAGFSFIYGLNTDTPIVGDWNGDGVDSPGIVRPTPPGTQLEWHLIDEIGQQQADVYIYGLSSDRPLSGDWNGDGVDWFGITRPNPNGVQRDWHLIDSSGQQNADVYTFGHASDRAVTGELLAAVRRLTRCGGGVVDHI